MNYISIFRGLATSVFAMILGTTTLQAKPHPQHSVKPITQPGNKHHSHPVNRPERPIRPPHHHRPSHDYRPPYYHRPPVVIRPPRYHSSFIYVRPGYWYPPYRGRYYYYHNDLVGIATFAIFAGVTYAIVQDAYYQQRGSRYVYVQNPPAGNYTVISGSDVLPNSASTTTNLSTVTTSPASPNQVSTTTTETSKTITKKASSPYKLGEIVDSLPYTKQTVVIDGQSYFKYQDTWFAPLRADRKYVVVESPL
ncbi:hypothetical protein ACOIXD_000134 [Vibrio parahaemolyticus]|nr:hypothetical protein [Vibrio parahaemolyticus]EHR4996113.1 hypothetical protein [Vibrio parahaemolyticus]EHR6685236.1 hypothetical protein [Vibrio parahaemolyticus]EHV5555546.1 hypothetical protein [Vibrio parahaemolyticus]EIV8488111.1 hypothetical protein [Vibrio parahaemolyticus]